MVIFPSVLLYIPSRDPIDFNVIRVIFRFACFVSYIILPPSFLYCTKSLWMTATKKRGLSRPVDVNMSLSKPLFTDVMFKTLVYGHEGIFV